jgi:hypothetical protein
MIDVVQKTTKHTINGYSISIFLRMKLMLFIVPDIYDVTLFSAAYKNPF